MDGTSTSTAKSLWMKDIVCSCFENSFCSCKSFLPWNHIYAKINLEILCAPSFEIDKYIYTVRPAAQEICTVLRNLNLPLPLDISLCRNWACIWRLMASFLLEFLLCILVYAICLKYNTESSCVVFTVHVCIPSCR